MKTNNGLKQFIAPIACIVLMLSGFHAALADSPVATSAAYELFQDVASGAGSTTSTSYAVSSVSGEPVASGSATSTSYELRPGYRITYTSAPPTVSFTAASQTGAEGAGAVTITAELSEVSGLDVEVPFTLGGTAEDGGVDYSITASPITISAGETTEDITITLNDDSLDENDETVVVTMGSPTNATRGAITEHTATITDNDDAPTVSFTTASQTGAEGSGAMTVTAELSGASGLDVEVPFTLGGAAEGGGVDYSITASPITISAGETTGDITITLEDDDLDENDETVVVTMGSPTNGSQGATTVHTATITDNDDAPTVSFTMAGQTGAEGAGAMTVTVQLSEVSGLDVEVPFTTGGTATGGGTDYSITASPVAISAGETTQTITITPNDDGLDENDETVIVAMGTPTNASLGATTEHTVTITDVGDAPTVSFTSASQTGAESSVALTITAELSEASGLDVEVPFTLGGTAEDGGADYSITTSPITIPAGETTRDITITLDDDSLDENDETVIVTMGSPTNATQGAITEHTATITDNDDAPTVSFTSAAQTGAESSGAVTVTLQLSGASGLDVEVPFTTGGTAAGGGTDYSITSSPVTISAGETTQTITITPANDGLDENDETVIVTMGTPTNATQGAITEHTVTITDVGDAPTVSFTSAGQTGAENEGAMTVAVRLSEISGLDVEVPFTLSGTATGGGADYSITASPVTISAGEATRTITITIHEDGLAEYDETVVVTMGSPTNAVQGAVSVHTATIADNDDVDGDGVSDIEESGPDGDDPGYDGNNDGTPDSTQPDIASLHTEDGEDYVTLATTGGHRLADVRAVPNPSPGDAPAHVTFPYGFFEFRVTGLSPGDLTTVALYLPSGATPDTYWKYGPTPAAPTPHWYEFMFADQTGAMIGGNIVVLNFVDGRRGDDNPALDGEIIDQGGPGVVAPIVPTATVPTLSEWGMILFALMLLGSAVVRLRRNSASP